MIQLEDIDPGSESAFFSCLHTEEPEDREATTPCRNWYREYGNKGCRAKVLKLDDIGIVGKCHTVPIHYSPFLGRDLLGILCLYVHLYPHQVGDQRGRGYGRFMLNQIEQEARSSGYKGVVAWAMDWDIWNPVSFYEHMGYARADQEDKVVAVWKSFCEDAESPRLMRLDNQGAPDSLKVRIVVADNPWCDGHDKMKKARKAIRGIEHLVEYTEAGPPYRDRILHLGHVGGVFLDGRAYRPYQVIGSSEDLRAEIIRLSELKR